MWLTAWVIRTLDTVSFQDWEDYIYVDPTVVGSAVMWLLNYQTEEGAFTETEHYPPDKPLHKPMDGRSRFLYDCANIPCDGALRNVSLTAHVLISLEVTAKNLQVWMGCKSSISNWRWSNLIKNMNCDPQLLQKK